MDSHRTLSSNNIVYDSEMRTDDDIFVELVNCDKDEQLGDILCQHIWSFGTQSLDRTSNLMSHIDFQNSR